MFAIHGGRVNRASCPSLSSDAIFIADAHHKQGNPAFPLLLDQLLNAPPKQVFLMGDIFHVLVGKIASSVIPHQAILEKIQTLSHRTQIFYFEGNHDLVLHSLSHFQHVRIYSRAQQPAFFLYQDRLLALAHGDFFVGWGYEFYISLLRRSGNILGYLDKVFPNLYPHIQERIDAKRIKTLELSQTEWAHFAQKRLDLYRAHAQKKGLNLDGVVEGHFHIGAYYQHPHTQEHYWGLPSFYNTRLISTLKTMSEN